MAESALDPRLCRLKAELGHAETCPEGRCAFWEPGGAVLDGRCALEGIDLTGRRDVAAWLLRVRRQLEAVGAGEIPRAREERARRVLYRLLGTGNADGG